MISDNFLWNLSLKYISKRERSEKDVRAYLKKIIKRQKRQDLSEQTIDLVIKKLKSGDFLNEDRFVRAYIHDNYQLQKKGPALIRQELVNRQIDEAIIDKYLAEISPENESDKALALAQKKHQVMGKLPLLTQKRRLYGFLVRHGFSPQIVFGVIDNIFGKRYN